MCTHGGPEKLQTHTHACKHSFFYLVQRKKRISYRELSFFIIQMYVLYLKLFADFAGFFLLLGMGTKGIGDWSVLLYST